MAAAASVPEVMDSKPDDSQQENPQSAPQDPPSAPPPAASADSIPQPAAAPENANPTPTPAANPNLPVVTPPPPPAASSFSFRPVGAPQAPQFSPLPNPSFPNPAFPNPMVQNPSLQPPGVVQPVSYAGAMTMPIPPPGMYYSAPGQPPNAVPRPYWQGPNGYMAVPVPSQTPGMAPPPGIPRFPMPYPAMVRPGFPPRPAPMNIIPSVSRPPAPGVGGAPIIPSMVRPVVPIVAPTEKPQTTVYVGKIASTAENEFLRSLLELCGPVKSWKRASDPSDGTPRGFGFCEFESAEGVLRAMRLLTKLNIDGQELVLNVNQATREYLERYVEKKTEREKLKESEFDSASKENGTPLAESQNVQTNEDSKKDEDSAEDKEKQDDVHKFGIVTDEDKDADKDALDKLKNMIEERLKTRPLPPPPPVPSNADGSAKAVSELPSRSRDGESEAEITKTADDKTEEEMSENKPGSEPDKAEGNSSDKVRRHDRSRERDRERDLKREKGRELERYERDRERERVRREREREQKIREVERMYKDRVKDWEAREREKEHHRLYEKEREKERENKRRREILDQEDESDEDDSRKRRRRSSMLEEKRRKRQREREEDLTDRLREEEEIAEAKKREAEEQKQKDEAEVLSTQLINGNANDEMQEDMENIIGSEDTLAQSNENDSFSRRVGGDKLLRNGSTDESNAASASEPEIKQNNNVPSRKLGFGLVGSGKRTSIPSVFHAEEDEDAEKDKKMRPLVPIDYSTEELEAVQMTVSGTSPNLAAAAEFAKRISGVSSKEEKVVSDKDRSRRSNDRHRDRSRNDDTSKHNRDENREQYHEKYSERGREREEKPRTTENKKLLDAKQLIDMIPKTKEELFSYEINWAVYDKHELHERMKPWISKKITEFLGEEEQSLVDYIVTSTNNHVKASDMLDLLQSILDEEAEMFVLKMWRMLIFEIKKVETGLSLKSKS